MSKSTSDLELGLLPLTIGITGHRDLREQDLEGLRASVRSIFHSIQGTADQQQTPYGALYRSTPLVLLSSLAEGADRLVAHVALECGASLVPVLPMPPEEYVQDFPDTVAEFHELFTHRKTLRHIVIPWPAQRDRDAVPLKDVQYLLAGAYVARHSQILIALWDGIESNKLGGTSQIVKFRQTGHLQGLSPELEAYLHTVPEPYQWQHSPLDPPETGPVYHVMTPRKSTHHPDQLQGWTYLAPEDYKNSPEKQRAYFARIQEIYGRISIFNEDMLRIVPGRPEKLSESRERLFPEHKAVHLRPPLQHLRDTYAHVDTLASFFQGYTHNILRWMFALVFVAVVCFSGYAHLLAEPAHLWPLTFYLGLLAIADCLYLYTKRRDYQNKYQDYRALAEGLRVQFFWRLAGLEHAASDHYLRKQKNELDWIRHAIRTCGLLVGAEPADNLVDVLRYWVIAQYKYFQRVSRRDTDKLGLLKGIGDGALLVSLGLAAAELLLHGHDPSMQAMVLIAVSLGYVHVRSTSRDLRKQGEESADDGSEARDVQRIETEIGASEQAGCGEELAQGRGEKDSKNSKYPYGIMLGFMLGLLLAIVLGYMPNFLLFLPEPVQHTFKEETHARLVVAMGLTAVIAAFLHSYAEKRALAEHYKQYKQMQKIFYRAMQYLSKDVQAQRLTQARELVYELGVEGLAEHGDWVLLHRERPIELPPPEI